MKIREPHREVERRERQNYLNPFPIKVLASTQHHYALVALPKDRKSTRLNSSHVSQSRMPSSA